MTWRLGLDMGSNSIGWWAFRVVREGSTGGAARWRPVASLDGGVLIFSDGREPSSPGRVGDSRAVARRQARAMRRNRDHSKNRRRRLLEDLTALGLLPADENERKAWLQSTKRGPAAWRARNPYALRAAAVVRTLEPYELGRTLMHLGLRRGFKSNRKEASEEDGGALKPRIDALSEELAGNTLGQYLWADLQAQDVAEAAGERRRAVRFKEGSTFYPGRKHYADEFDAIRKRQEPHHALTPNDWARLRDQSILFQWPLRSVERGHCEFLHEEPRHWHDTPLGHDFRLYQELNNLEWIGADQISYPLSGEQRGAILERLLALKSDVKFTTLRNLKDGGERLFPAASRFNLEGEKRKALKPHRIAAALTANEELAPLWSARESAAGDGGRLDDIFESLHGASDNDAARKTLVEDHGLSPAQADALCALPLGAGTASVSRKFMAMIVPVLRDQGLRYHDAVAELTDKNGEPLHHSLRDDGQRWERLPYYGEVLRGSTMGTDPAADPVTQQEKHFGKIANPTVHVALNQLRKLVNALIERFGEAPVEIHVELTREIKLPRKHREQIERDQGANQKRNERIRERVGQPNLSARDLKKIKLWEELGKDDPARRCVFTGKVISLNQLLNGEAEIEHLLPFSRTLDDSMANLTVAMRAANRLKGNRTAHEAFGSDAHAKDGYVWAKILERAENLPNNKRWRFGPDAMARYVGDSGFIARQLTDTAYMTRVAQRYLKAIDGVEQVVPNPGRLTAMIRGKWHLNGILSDDNRKTRDDHRHHAIDAAVIALVDRAVLQRVARDSARGADDVVHINVPDLNAELESAIRARVPQIVVAFKPDHGHQGRMVKETAYGFVPEGGRDPDLLQYNLVTRKPLVALSAKEVGAIRDASLRDAVTAWVEAAKARGEKADKALADFAQSHDADRVRILVTDQTAQAPASAPYKAYAPDGYVCCDIWRLPKGRAGNWKKGEYTWRGVFWSYADAVSGIPDAAQRKPHPAARLITRVFKDDMVEINHGGVPAVMRVAGFSTTNNKLDVRPHNLAVSNQTYVSINVLGKAGLRKLRVEPDGLVQGLREAAK